MKRFEDVVVGGKILGRWICDMMGESCIMFAEGYFRFVPKRLVQSYAQWSIERPPPPVTPESARRTGFPSREEAQAMGLPDWQRYPTTLECQKTWPWGKRQ